MVEKSAAQEEAALVSGHFETSAVGYQLRPLAYADIDVACDALERLTIHDRAHFDTRIHAVSDPQGAGALREPGNDPIRDVAHQYGDTDCHAALASRSVGRSDQAIDRLLEVGVRHHDQMILRAAECLHAFAELRAACVQAPRDGRRADEAQGLYLWMLEQRIDGDFVALHDIEHAMRQAGLLE